MINTEVFTVKGPKGLKDALKKAANKQKKTRNRFALEILAEKANFKI